MGERVTIKEAADRLGVSQDTIRRRLKTGELVGEREKTRQGFVWRVALPQDVADDSSQAGVEETMAAQSGAIEVVQLRERVAGLERLTDELASERDAWRQQAARDGEASRELRILLQHAQAFTKALPTTTTEISADAPTLKSEATTTRGEQAVPASMWRRLWIRLGIT